MIAEPGYSTKPTDGRDLEPVQSSSILVLVVVVVVIIIVAFFPHLVLCEFSEPANKEQGTQQPRRMS